MSALDKINLNGIRYDLSVPTEEMTQTAVNEWLDEHPEATTTVEDNSLTTAKYKDYSVTKEKLSKELLSPVYCPNDYVTINNLMDLSVAETYALFDAYVSEGLLTKTRIGYGSASTSGDEATEDTTLPIYMYSYRNKMAGATNYTTSSYAKPILLGNAMHGNEKLGVPVMLTMLEEYKNGKAPQITKLFDDFGVDFIPILNPYGYNQAIGTTMETVESNIGRLNARGVDINRNGVTCWASVSDSNKGNAPLSECESKIIHDIAVTHGDDYSFYIDIHTERYNQETHKYFGTVSGGSSLIKTIYSMVLSNMNERMASVYGYDMYDDLNGSSIVGHLNRYPMHFIDRCYSLDSQATACLYEAPRYIDGEIYPIKSQKFTCDILINFLINTMDFLKSYKPLYNAIDRAYLKSKILQKDILPTTKDGWEYGYVVNGTEHNATTKIRTANKIPVDDYAYYDIVPSYDNLYYSIDLYNDLGGGHVTYIDWAHGQTKIYTDAYTHIRVNISTGNPDTTANGINMPDLWHDYDLVVKKADLSDEDISSLLSSSVATVDYARLQKVGRMAFVVMRLTLTADVNANSPIVSGLPLDINNYTGLNNIRLYDNNNQTCYDGYITHGSGANSSTLNCLSNLVNGHSIRATFMYFTAQ